MKTEVPRILNRINENDVFKSINHNFENIATEWWKFQFEWNSNAYTPFKDHEKTKKLLSIFITKIFNVIIT